MMSTDSMSIKDILDWVLYSKGSDNLDSYTIQSQGDLRYERILEQGRNS